MRIKSKKFKSLLFSSIFIVSTAFFSGCNKTEKAQLNESVCIETGEGCSRIFSRGIKLPASFSETYSNMEDGQDILGISLYQGEDSKIESNHLIGTFDIPIKQKDIKEGDLNVQITFMIDQSKKLTIVTKEMESGKENEILAGIVN